MFNVWTDTDKLIKTWVGMRTDMDLATQDQTLALTKLPFLYKHVALMPDAHFGYGMPIGGVLATEDVVIPNAVGVDIGCGVNLTLTNIMRSDLSSEQLLDICEKVKEVVPVGFKKHLNTSKGDYLNTLLGPVPRVLTLDPDEYATPDMEDAARSLGTLGGGNHFIELQELEGTGELAVMLHSGSRSLGHYIGTKYNELARALNKRWYSTEGSDINMSFLPVATAEGTAYIQAMKYAVRYAKLNRALIREAVLSILHDVYPDLATVTHDVSHNYVTIENHYGKNVWVHRKGAIRAAKGQLGLVPGSIGTSSYIVEGLGNAESFHSCSHGAGRVMSRTKARKGLSLEKEQAKLKDCGVISHGLKGAENLDEAPGSYKDIDVVMENQKDLVTIRHRLKPVASIKG